MVGVSLIVRAEQSDILAIQRAAPRNGCESPRRLVLEVEIIKIEPHVAVTLPAEAVVGTRRKLRRRELNGNCPDESVKSLTVFG